MDLSEALKFKSKECVQKSEVEPTLTRNRPGLTHSCASSNGTALFHFLPQTQTITLYQSSTNYTPLSQFHAKDVIHMSCSFDGRLLLLLHADSSVTCIDVTSAGMTVRFTLKDVHSHSSVYGMHTVGKRLRANIHRGPVHSVTFNNTSGYDCLVVDAIKGVMVIDCQAGGIKRTISNQSLPSNILCADWDYNGEDGDLVAGFEDGSIAFMHTPDDMEIIIPDAVEENDEDVNWSCTHIQSFSNHVAVGLCRVFDGEDENDDNISEEDLDEDDEASHEANLLIYNRESREWTELGDVVAFFAVPMFGRHVFYTTFLSKQNILLVGCNVTGEAGIVAETDGGWQVCELQEGDSATTPLTEDDEFTLPSGLSCVSDGSSHLNLVMSSTDGSLSVFDIEHIEYDKFAVSESIGAWRITNTAVEETVLHEEKNAATETSKDAEEIQDSDKDSNTKTSLLEQAEENQEQEVVTSAFGSGSNNGFSFGTSTEATPAFGSGASKPVFGSTTPFGSPSTSTPTSAPFGGAVFGSTSGLSSTTSSFGTSAFGLSSVKQGAFSLASKANQSESAPKLSEAEKNAPIFGSGSSAPVFGSGTTPAFGSGSSAPVFGSGTNTTSSGFGSLAQSSVDGFGALASAVTGDNKGFGFKNVPTNQKSIFGASTQQDKTNWDSGIVKPIFGGQSPLKNTNYERTTPIKQMSDDIVDIVPSTAQAKNAGKAFDVIDQDKAQKVPTSKLDQLVDEVGEGLHGDELDKQLSILDPDSTGYITRTSFINWYCKLVEGSDDDDGSLDTDEREEREEERNKATDAFDAVANAGIVHKSEFGDLMEAMGTTYCEEEHRRTLRKISDDDGNITQEAFVSWYMDWLFGDGDSDSDYSDEENGEIEQQDTTAASSSTGWGSTFAVDKDSWKCESCMLRNNGSDVKCVACETVRPGHEDKVTAGDKNDAPSSSTGTGFTFSSANANAGGGGSNGGFSFGFSGTPAPAPSSTTTAGGGTGGFSFGFSGTSAPVQASNDKKEGDAFSKSGTGFTFGLPSSDFVKTTTSTNKPASSSAFPPMSAKAPTPFGATTKTTTSTSKPASSSAFPPMSAKAPTPFGAATTNKPSSSSAFPPMSAKAPIPFGNNKGTNDNKSMNQSLTSSSKLDYVPANEYESQFWRILSDYENTLQDLKSLNCELKIDTKEVNSIVQGIEKALGELSSLKGDVCSDNDFSLLLLSRCDDIERQIEVSKKNISAHFDHDKKVSESDSVQSLDIESERNRRKILHKSLGIKNSINRLNDLIDLTSSMKKKTEAASQPNLFSWTPSRRTRKSSAPRGDRILVKQLMSGYQRSKELERHVYSVSRRLEEFSHVEAGKAKLSLSNPVVTKTTGGRNRITALPFSSPKSKSFAAPSQTNRESKLIAKDAMKLLQESFSINPKSFKVHSLSSASNDQNRSTSSTWRTKTSSQMMKLGTYPASSSKNTSNILLTSEDNSASARSLWHQSDSAGMESVKLSLPSTLKQIDAAEAAKEALVPFGVTPDEMTTVKKALQQGDTLNVENPSSKPTVKVAMKKGSKSAAFPPLSVKAPTPFGASNLAGTTTKGPSSSSSTKATSAAKPLEYSTKNKELKKTNSSAQFPPMATTAPTPFSTTTKQKADSKTENKAATAFSLPKTNISLSKTTSNDQVKQKEDAKSSLFGGFGSMGKALDMPSTKQDLFGSTTKKEDNSSVDYLTIMTKFYQQYNPSKIGEVPNTLQKYQGREKELFEKLAKKYNVPNPLKEEKVKQNAPAPPPTFGSTSETTQISTSSSSSPDYKAILTKFYQTHNPSKISEVEKHLVKYQGREREMFAKLAMKYKVPDPLLKEIGSSSVDASAPKGFGASNASGFGAISGSSPFGSTQQKPSSSNMSPFGNSGNSPTPFGGVGSSATKSSASPFGQSSGFAPSPSPFGQPTSPSPFGQTAAPSPFGQTSAQSSTTFGQQASSQKLFGGKTAREHLTLFYQQRNPSKIGDVDKLLAKYAGKEDQLLANLAKKYNISPATFGLASAPAAAPAFGSPSAMGGANTFGQPSPMGGGGGFGSPSPAPSSGFGSFGAAAQAPSQGFGGFGAAPASGGFGAVAQAPSGFGAAPASGGFGSSAGFGAATPFGAARR